MTAALTALPSYISADRCRDLGDEAADLVPFAAELIGTVHDYGREEIAGVIRRHLGLDASMGDEVRTSIAALVVLAAMCDPERTPEEALSWVTWDEHGARLGEGDR